MPRLVHDIVNHTESPISPFSEEKSGLCLPTSHLSPRLLFPPPPPLAQLALSQQPTASRHTRSFVQPATPLARTSRALKSSSYSGTHRVPSFPCRVLESRGACATSHPLSQTPLPSRYPSHRGDRLQCANSPGSHSVSLSALDQETHLQVCAVVDCFAPKRADVSSLTETMKNTENYGDHGDHGESPAARLKAAANKTKLFSGTLACVSLFTFLFAFALLVPRCGASAACPLNYAV